MSGQIKFTPPQPADLTAQLNGYEVHDLVATGGMGAVYRATHISLDRMVAIKVLPREFADASFHEQFQAEARAMAKLNHPNLIGIYDFGTTDTGLPFIVMEFVAGKSLYYSAYKKAIEESTAVRITREICEGLAQAHKNNIIHRDIKPANILMDPDAHAKIGDFGLASQTDAGPQHSSDDVVYGTPGYAAPEIIHNPAAIGKPSDIFAVGVILYELLTGHLPDPQNPKPASRLANTDPRLDRIIRKATHSNPAMRYQDAEEMAEDLNKISMSSGPAPGPRGTSRLNKRSGPVQVQPGHRTGPMSPQSAGARVTKSGRIMTTPEKTAPILTKPKKITGKVAGRTSDDYEENTDLSSERRVSSRRKRPKDYKGPMLPDPGAAPAGHTAPHQVKAGSHLPFLRNILIILVLLPLLYFLWGVYKDKQERVAQEAENIRQAELIEKERRIERRRLLTDEGGGVELGNGNNATSSAKGTTRPKAAQPKEKIKLLSKTPMDQLRELKSSLSNGAREVMPDTVIVRGTQFLMPILEKMTWSDACRFAEEHGAHLATPTTEAELAWFSSNLPDGVEEIWIGGGAQGKTEWAWVTGEPWNHRKPSTNLGSCALLTVSGTIKARAHVSQYPFFLQWNRDGENPASLSAQLERLKKTLDSPSPEWPPGTISFQARHYFHVSRKVDWEEADLMANSGGGHLVVFSDRVESSYLTDRLQEFLRPGESIWLSGLKEKDDWVWSTGEPMTFPQWRDGFPGEANSDNSIRFVSQMEKSGWESVNRYDARSADGFLIEWSKDRAKQAGGKGPIAADPASELAKLQKLGQRQLVKHVREYNKLLQDSRKNFTWKMGEWFNKNPKTRRESYQSRFDRYNEEAAKSARITDELDRTSMPAGIRQLYDEVLENQKRYERELNRKILSLRNAYLGKLLEARDAAASAKKAAEADQLDLEIKAIGQDVASFRRHFGK